MNKLTKGSSKMETYINKLVRNKNFRAQMKKLISTGKKVSSPKGKYDEWSLQERINHDRINVEISEIIDGYETLRKRCKKIFSDDYFKNKNNISENYYLDNYQIEYIRAIIAKNDTEYLEHIKDFANIDVCRVYDVREEFLSPLNKGEEIIYLNKSKQMELQAYPIAICINPLASKRDLLDYIEKKWPLIEDNFLGVYYEKKLKIRQTKHAQELLDFIWDNKFLDHKKLKLKLNEKFPKNILAYYEIKDIIRNEKKKRLANLM